MNTPNPDPGEELPHINTQLFGILDKGNRFKLAGGEVLQRATRGSAPDDGRVRGRLHQHADRRARPSADGRGVRADHDRLHARADARAVGGRAGFATFDHWFCDVPTCTYPNRSFFHAGSSSGFVVNMSPPGSFPRKNNVETLFDRLDAAGLTWKVYCDPPSHYSLTGLIHAPRLAPVRDQLLLDAAVLRGRRERPAADVLVHRAADHRLEPQRHAPAVRRVLAVVASRRRRGRTALRPAVLADRRRGPAGAHLRRDPQLLLTDRLEPPQHDPARDLRRARRHL